MAAARHSRDPEQGRLCKQLVVQGRTEWIFSTAQCWHVTALTGKGYGVVATRAIGRGELIMAESPLATYIKHAYRAHHKWLVARTVDSLPPAQRPAPQIPVAVAPGHPRALAAVERPRAARRVGATGRSARPNRGLPALARRCRAAKDQATDVAGSSQLLPLRAAAPVPSAALCAGVFGTQRALGHS